MIVSPADLREAQAIGGDLVVWSDHLTSLVVTFGPADDAGTWLCGPHDPKQSIARVQRLWPAVAFRLSLGVEEEEGPRFDCVVVGLDGDTWTATDLSLRDSLDPLEVWMHSRAHVPRPREQHHDHLSSVLQMLMMMDEDEDGF